MIGSSFTVVLRFYEVGSETVFPARAEIVKPNERVSDRENVRWKSLMIKGEKKESFWNMIETKMKDERIVNDKENRRKIENGMKTEK